MSPSKVIKSFSTSTLVCVLLDRKDTALVTIMSCPQGLLINKISKNKSARMPKTIRPIIFKNLNLFFLVGFGMSLCASFSKQIYLNYKFIILIMRIGALFYLLIALTQKYDIEM